MSGKQFEPRGSTDSPGYYGGGRFLALVLITVGTLIAYLDRSAVSLAAPAIAAELSLAPTALGLVFAAFSAAYVFCQIPAGVLLDRLGSRLTYGASAALWSVAAAIHGLVPGLSSLIGARFLLGCAEAPCFPTNSRVVASWFPKVERGRASSIFVSIGYVGLAAFAPVLIWTIAERGWRAMFFLLALLSFVFAIVWMALYRERRGDEGANVDRQAASVARSLGWREVGRVARHPVMIGLCAAQFASSSIHSFIFTWLPTYLAASVHPAPSLVGGDYVLTLTFGFGGVMLGGVVSDLLMSRTGSGDLARKAPMVVGLLVASAIWVCNFLEGYFHLVVLSVALFGKGLASVGWATVADLADPRARGLTAGIFNVAANSAAVVTPLVIGMLVEATGGYHYVTIYLGGLAFAGALAFHLTPKLEVIVVD